MECLKTCSEFQESTLPYWAFDPFFNQLLSVFASPMLFSQTYLFNGYHRGTGRTVFVCFFNTPKSRLFVIRGALVQVCIFVELLLRRALNCHYFNAIHGMLFVEMFLNFRFKSSVSTFSAMLCIVTSDRSFLKTFPNLHTQSKSYKGFWFLVFTGSSRFEVFSSNFMLSFTSRKHECIGLSGVVLLKPWY